MKVEQWPLSRIKPYDRNPRVNDDAVAAVAASIKRFGFRQPIVVDVDGVIVAGHTRYRAALLLKLDKVPVHVAKDLTPEQIRAYRIADNKTNELAEWNLDLLTLELKDLQPAEIDWQALGFTEVELGDLLGAGLNDGLCDPDEVPPTPTKPITQPGDLWLLGDHRLLCGDCTKVADVQRLMGADRAVLMNTDPPYGIDYDVQDNYDAANSADGTARVSHYQPISNDRLNGGDLQGFLELCIRSAVPYLKPTAAFYLWHPMLTQGTFFAAAAAAADILIHRQIIWSKGHMIFGRGDYHWQHELCFYGWRRGHRPKFFGERNQTTIWSIDNPRGKEHPTQKPVELFSIPLRNHTKAGELCYEPFAGSGSQIIAAEQLCRRCFAIEIEPRYVDVCVARWEKFSGQKARRAGASAPATRKPARGKKAKA